MSLACVMAAVVRLGRVDATFIVSDHRLLKLAVMSAAVVMGMSGFDVYNFSILGNHRLLLIRLSQAFGTVYAVLALLYYVYPPLDPGQQILISGLVFAAMMLFLWRRLFSIVNKNPEFSSRTLILGEGVLASLLVHEFASRPELGLRVVGRALVNTGADCRIDSGEMQRDSHERTMAEDLCNSVGVLRANRIIVAMGDRRGKLPVDLLLSLKFQGVRIQDGVEVYENITGKVPIEAIRTGWLIFSPGWHISRFHLITKRCMSVAISIIGLVLTLPFLPFIVALIKLSSAGPVLYRQRRVGRNGVIFNCYKFRTMRQDAEADTGPTWAADDDPRITRIGGILRGLRIDEIPQLWNVLRGDMSFVGPRPERPEFVQDLTPQIPYYHLRHSVRPGITGWAQIRYKYGNTVEDAKEKLRYDLFYIKNMSAGLDLLIFLETIKVILWRQGSR